ncbi:hypothetical protein [Vibrio alginolyticus]|uniref:hypothetical protein n=1 Tax=Vibrio TaxID=662 RepID=UPI0006CA7B4F|nr:hypothetical protein [Vibrio alginolyticus]KPM97609.1 hypothetical protein AOG25_14170 [Vibrio alginolyticus]CAH7370969.1 conserved hypothetical protein [Vibrio chagasii]
MKELILEAQKELGLSLYKPSISALSIQKHPMFDKMIAANALSGSLNATLSLSDISKSKSAVKLLQAMQIGDTNNYFDCVYRDFVKNFQGMIEQVCKLVDIVNPLKLMNNATNQFENTLTSYMQAADILAQSDLYLLCESDGSRIDSIPLSKKALHFVSMRDAANFASSAPPWITFANIGALNKLNSASSENQATLLINNGQNVYALMLKSSSGFISGIPKPNNKQQEVNLSSDHSVAIMLAVLTNQLDYVHNEKLVSKGSFSVTEETTKNLPANITAPCFEVPDVTSEQLLYSKINPKFAWIDEHLNSNYLKHIINLKLEHNMSGVPLCHYLEKHHGDAQIELTISLYRDLSGMSCVSRCPLLSYDVDSFGNNTDLLNNKLKVARFNKAKLAFLTLQQLFYSSSIKTELQTVLQSLDNDDIIEALKPILNEDANGNRTPNSIAYKIHYRNSSINYLHNSKSFKGLFECYGTSLKKAYENGYNYDSMPVFDLDANLITRDYEGKFKEAKCAVKGTKANKFLSVNLRDHRVLSAIVDLYLFSVDKPIDLPNIDLTLRATTYEPEFDSQTFGSADIQGMASYPTDREVEDYIVNPFFSLAQLIIPLGNTGAKSFNLK